MPSETYPTIHRPPPERVAAIAEQLGLELTDEELADYAELLDGALADVERIVELPSPEFELHRRTYTDRPAGHRPTDDDNPCNVWITKCTVEGDERGPLAGRTVGLKDNIALAGYEMTCGSRLLRGYAPQIDATVVTRLLDAGATISGKLNMEAFAWSGSSDISDYGTVPNPHDPSRLAGGSSSGSGAAVALGECDIALGGDQGGSIRIPASWCGIVGLKPTTGLVPYTGIFPLDPTIDHVGPMTQSVEDAAVATEVLAGEDRQNGVKMDARQPRGVSADDYTAALDEAVDGMTLGVLEEGFDWDESNPAVDRTVRGVVDELESRGANVESVSVDYHRDILSLITPMEIQGGTRLVEEAGVGTHHTGWYWSDLIDAFEPRKESRADELPPTAKNSLIVGTYLADEFGIEFYAKAKNVILELERQLNEHLDRCDALVMPTIPMLPYERDESLSRVERVGRIVENHRNTATFDHTHHPALTLPCGSVDGFPVGMQLVGSHFDERTLFTVAQTVEEIADAPELPVSP
ncbi:amidase [Haloplanus sp. GCM10025708]|uniref:amidase n=1 Tax=Haloferacaceae TaxID=1644056 RepID=UPI003618325D